jgi:hypothetical protein
MTLEVRLNKHRTNENGQHQVDLKQKTKQGEKSSLQYLLLTYEANTQISLLVLKRSDVNRAL